MLCDHSADSGALGAEAWGQCTDRAPAVCQALCRALLLALLLTPSDTQGYGDHYPSFMGEQTAEKCLAQGHRVSDSDSHAHAFSAGHLGPCLVAIANPRVP